MPSRSPLRLVAACLALLAVPASAHATEVWSGRTFSFAKANFADPTVAANQDRITSNVWITRDSSHGIYNAEQESVYGPLSPLDTEWATGDAVNHASLTFQPWVNWANSNPPSTVGVNAVVHLITDDIYIDIRFDSWTSSGQGGGFSYTRAVAPTNAVGPASAAFALRGFQVNPARPGTPIVFSLPDAAPARLEVIDVSGRLIARRDVGALGAGVHRVTLNELQSQPAGLLFVRLTRAGVSRVVRAAQIR